MTPVYSKSEYRRLDSEAGELYLAGQAVPPGIYRQIGTGRILRLDTRDILPASLDGRVACYERVETTWGQMQQEKSPLPQPQ